MNNEKRTHYHEFSQRKYNSYEDYSYKKKGFLKGFFLFFYNNKKHFFLHLAMSFTFKGFVSIFTLPFTLPVDYLASVSLAEMNNQRYYLELIDIIQTKTENENFIRGQELFRELFPKDQFIYDRDDYWRKFRSTNLFVFRGYEYKLFALCDKSYLAMHGLSLDQKLWDVKLWPEYKGTLLKFSQHIPEFYFYHCISPYMTPRYNYNWSLHMFSYELFMRDIHYYYPYSFVPVIRSWVIPNEFSDWEARQAFKKRREERSPDYSKKLLEDMREYFKKRNRNLNLKKSYIPKGLIVDIIRVFWGDN